MVPTPPKRAASTTPDGRPSKRPAPSSPEEGEVDSDAAVSPRPAKERTASPSPKAAEPSTSKVAFPFKRKPTLTQDDAAAPPMTNGLSKGVYVRPEELNRRFAEDNVGNAPSYGQRRRPHPRDAWSAGDHYPRSPNHYPQRRGWDARSSGNWDNHGYPQHGDRYHPPRDERDRRAEYAYPPPVDRYPSRDRDWERERDRDRDPSRSPTRSPTRSATGRSPSPATSRKEKHRLPAPRSPTVVFSPISDTRHWEAERDHGRDRDRDRHWGHSGGADRYRPRDDEHRYRGLDSDPGGHYRREPLEDYDHRRHYRQGQHDYGRENHRDDWYERRDRYDEPRDPYIADNYRPISPRPVPDRKPSTPRPPPPTSMEPRSSPPPPLDAAPPPPPPLFDRNKDETLPPEHATVSIAVRKREEQKAEGPSMKEEKPEETKFKETTVAPRKRRAPVHRSREEEKEAYGKVFIGCGKQSDYEFMSKLGEGTFGEVHKAVHKSKGHVVALKRILMHNEKEGMPVTALREIKILKALNHPCIVNILDMFLVRSTKDSPLSVYMVFPYMDHDLAGLLENERVKLSPSQIKLYMKQLLEGTDYMHRNRILHRDMKAANLLISNTGSLQIADFGLARAFDPGIVREIKGRDGRDRKYTNCVVTRWYRPPELLLGARQYGGEVDIWGIGCVLGEMFMRRPILPGTSDLDQLDKIWQMCGTPNQQTWPNYDALPGCEGVKRFQSHSRKIKHMYEMLGPETNDLLDKLLVCNPSQRITASQALDHEYFWTDPLPADPKSLPQYEASHELDKRSRRQHGPPPDANNGPPRPPPMHAPPQPVALPPIHFSRGPPPPREVFRTGPPPPHVHGQPMPMPQHGPYTGPPPSGYGPPPGGYGPPPGAYAGLPHPQPAMYGQGPSRGYGGPPPPPQGGSWRDQGLPPRPPLMRGGPPPLPPPSQGGGLNYG